MSTTTKRPLDKKDAAAAAAAAAAADAAGAEEEKLELNESILDKLRCAQYVAQHRLYFFFRLLYDPLIVYEWSFQSSYDTGVNPCTT
jgi:hypothetical protein